MRFSVWFPHCLQVLCLFVVVVSHPASSVRALSRLPKGKAFQLLVFTLFWARPHQGPWDSRSYLFLFRSFRIVEPHGGSSVLFYIRYLRLVVDHYGSMMDKIYSILIHDPSMRTALDP